MRPAPDPIDAAERAQIRGALDESLLVEASAGTGKTHELIERLLATLLSGRAEIGQLAVLTYTRKAAGELKLRLRLRLDQALREPGKSEAERARAEAAVAQLETARVGTIHSFCGDLLREHPVEAGVDPSFVELSDAPERALFSRVFSRFLQEKLQDPPPGIRRALARRQPSWSTVPTTPVQELETAAKRLAEQDPLLQPWTLPDLDLEAALDEALELVLEYYERLQEQRLNPKAAEILAPLTQGVEELRALAAHGPLDYARVEALLFHLQDLNYYKLPYKMRDAGKALGEALKLALAEAEAHFAAQLQRELVEVVERFKEQKRRLGYLDFSDLIERCRAMLAVQPKLCRRLQARFSVVLIDEFQDTGPAQVELLLRLTAEDPAAAPEALIPRPGALFLVGDPKQSIYGFRDADLRGYQDTTGRLRAAGIRRLQLKHSFRASAPLQALVNAAFSPLFKDYAPLSGGRPPIEDQDSVIALPMPDRAPTIRKVQAESIAAFVRWLIHDSGWTVREADGERVPIAPEHIAILLRSEHRGATDWGVAYAEALEAERIPQLLPGDRQAAALPEVQLLLAALTAIEWPSDRLAVFSALAGPLFSLPADTLWRYQASGGKLHPLAEAPEQADPELSAVGAALAALARLHRARNERPIAETLSALYAHTGAHVSLGLRDNGRRAIAQLEQLQSQARRFEEDGGLSFAGFVEALREELSAGHRSKGAPLEERAPGVRIMTAHSAKGLEFPVVILGGADQSTPNTPDRWVDRARGLSAVPLCRARPKELQDAPKRDLQAVKEETQRLCYVAATRARELLVVPVAARNNKGKRFDAPGRSYWLEALDPVLIDAQPGHPEAGARLRAHPEGPRVRWWEPGERRPQGARAELLSDRDGFLRRSEAAEAHTAAFERWQEACEDAIYEGEPPSLMRVRPTEAARLPERELPLTQVQISSTPGPAGLRFGALMHQLLAELPLSASAEEIEAAAKLWARVLSAPAEEEAEAIRLAKAAWALPLLDRARAAKTAKRALPIIVPTPAGERVDTQIDLCFGDERTWVVVDFKTGSGDPEGRRRLLSWAAAGLGAQTGAPVSAVLLTL